MNNSIPQKNPQTPETPGKENTPKQPETYPPGDTPVKPTDPGQQPIDTQG